MFVYPPCPTSPDFTFYLNGLTQSQAQYKSLQTYIAKFDLRITDPEDKVRFPGGRYLALPAKSTVEWYAKSLGKSLSLGDTEDIKKRMDAALVAWVESPAPATQGMTQEQFLAQREEMLVTEREIELLAIATRMADQQTRRNIECAYLFENSYRCHLLTYATSHGCN